MSLVGKTAQDLTKKVTKDHVKCTNTPKKKSPLIYKIKGLFLHAFNINLELHHFQNMSHHAEN